MLSFARPPCVMLSSSSLCCIVIWLLALYTPLAFASSSDWIIYPDTGLATLTHYDLPSGFVAACGCTPSSTNYPTAALSQMAFGSSAAYGPSCGRCFNLSLINPLFSTPPFIPPVIKSIVVKVTDMCPLSNNGYCSGTNSTPNSAGAYLNFDLAYPSVAIPNDFFPSDEALYGYKDFGVWNVTYQSVSCSNWGGFENAAALGSVASLGTAGGCCPADPTPGNASNICPSYSDNNGLAPDTITNASLRTIPIPSIFLLLLTLFTWN